MNVGSRSLGLVWTLSALILTLLLLATAPVGRQRNSAQLPKPVKGATFVGVVSRSDNPDRRSTIDAIALVVNGKLRQPFPEYNEAAQGKFAAEYFAAGKKYRLTFGGGEVGSVTVKGVETGCNNIHATATVEDNGKVPAHLMSIATNSDSLGKKPTARRAPTDAERAAANLLVTEIYRSRGATRAVLRTVVTTNLTATDLDGDGRFELIGSFTAESKTKAHKDLLLIAEPVGAKFRAALINFQAYQLPPEGFDSAVDFVDQLDLDGDGIAEVFVLQHGFDAYGFGVYKKAKGRWRQVYTTAGDAC